MIKNDAGKKEEKKKDPVMVPGLDEVIKDDKELKTALAMIDAEVSLEMARRYNKIKNK